MSKNTGTSELINYFDLGANGDVGIAGSLDVNTIANATTDTDKFLVSDTGIIKYRTGAELLSDIGAAPAVAGGYVPYTGATTNVDLGIYNITAHTIRATGSANNAGQINLRSDAIFSLVNGYGTIGSGTTNQFNFYQTTGAGVFRGAIFSLNSITASATRTFTLPDADGTLALTSSLSGYLPLTGGTLTGALNGTSASFTGNIITSAGFFNFGNNYGIQARNFQDTAYRTIFKLNTSNQVEIGRSTDISDIILGTASATNALTIATTGAATFSSSVTANSVMSLGNDGTFGSGYKTLGLTGNTNGTHRIFAGTTDDMFFAAATGRGFDFRPNGTATTTLYISSGGDATFSSSVTSKVNNISADGAGVVLQGYVDNNLRIAVRGSGYNSGARGGLIASNGDFSGSLTVLSNNGIVVGAGGRAFIRQTIGGDAEIGAPLNGTLSLISNGVTALSFNGAGTATFETSAAISAVFNSTNTNGGYIGFRRAGTNIGYLGNSAQLGQGILNALELRADYGLFLTTTAGLLTMTIGGNVGINTNNPGGFLEVSSPNSNNVQMLLVRNFAVSATGNFTGNYTAEVRGASAGNIRHAMLIHSNENALDRRILDVTSLVGTVAAFCSNGNVGIGTASPSYKLDVQASTISYVFNSQNTRNVSGDANALFLLGNNANNTSSYFLICSMASGDKMYVYGNGNIVNINNSYGALSDIKLKENIEDATPKLNDLMKVKIRNYNLIGENTKQLGVIAQELEEIFPAMIDESPDKDKDGNYLGTTTKSVKYSVFVPMLIKAIQEQQEQIDKLKNA